MTETVKIVTRSRRSEPAQAKTFSFTPEQVRTSGLSKTLVDYRQRAWQTFVNLPMPSLSDEAWRRTDLKSLPADRLRLPPVDAYQDLAPLPQELLQPLVDDAHGGEILLMPGGSEMRLDSELSAKGVIFTDLKTAESDFPWVLDLMMGKVVPPEEGKFAALASALAQNGVVLYVPKGVHVDLPLHSLVWGPGADLALISHVLVWLDEGASATYVHELASPQVQSGDAMHAGVVEIRVGAGARLRFVELQSWGENIWNFTHERANVERDGSLEWVVGSIGSRLTKNFSEINLLQPGATGKMSGFYFADKKQHLDHDTQQNHRAPYTTSDLLFKGALLDESRSVWQGMIYVAPDAKKTDGYQANRNLVLSRGARADSIPGLEICADDVRCTHGATVGKIDPDQIFYLEARGIPRREAERLVVEGFFEQIMQRIPFEGVRKRFEDAIQQKMAGFSGT